MFDYYITFRSATAAQRGEEVLAYHNLRARLLRTPKALSQKGCGYALKLRDLDGEAAGEILAAYGVAYQAVYKVYHSGSVEEATL